MSVANKYDTSLHITPGYLDNDTASEGCDGIGAQEGCWGLGFN